MKEVFDACWVANQNIQTGNGFWYPGDPVVFGETLVVNATAFLFVSIHLFLEYELKNFVHINDVQRREIPGSS